jgi:hypothetical protein
MAMLSFNLTREGRAIQIECDDSGIDALIGALTKGSGSHVHLWAPATVGDDFAVLSDVTPSGEQAIREVIISHGGD